MVRAMLSVPWTRAVLYLLIFSAMGMLVLVIHHHRSSARRAQDFVEVQGTVVKSELQQSSSKSKPLPFIRVTYEYEGRRGWTSVTPALGIEEAGDIEYEELVERYPIGTPVAVFVNPDDPSQTALTRRYDPSSEIGGMVVLLVFLGVVIFMDVRRIQAGRQGAVAQHGADQVGPV